MVRVSPPHHLAAGYSYDEYGVPAATNSGRFQYTGQLWLHEIGVQYSKARMYAPHLGRFPQPDPVGYGDSPNLYAYALSDPTNLNDPLGLQCTGTRIESGCGAGGLGDTYSGFSTAGPGGQYETGWQILDRLGLDYSRLSDAQIRAFTFGLWQTAEFALAVGLPRDMQLLTWFGSTSGFGATFVNAGYSKWGPVFGSVTSRTNLSSRGVLTTGRGDPFADIDTIASWNNIPCLCLKGGATGIPVGWVMFPISGGFIISYHGGLLQFRDMSGNIRIEVSPGLRVGSMLGDLSQFGEVIHYGH